jgi:hypothetical protein
MPNGGGLWFQLNQENPSPSLCVSVKGLFASGGDELSNSEGKTSPFYGPLDSSPDLKHLLNTSYMPTTTHRHT